jgi:hypothetical protein
MPNYTVVQGECISSIAMEHGLFWEKVWNHPNNAELKRRREDPNVLHPGDVVFIPEKEEKLESGATEQRHRFQRKGEPSRLRLRVLDGDEPRSNRSYVLSVDGILVSGTTDADGRLEVGIPGNAKKAELKIGSDIYRLQLGGVDPVSEITGIQARLNNLGFACGPVDGEFGPKTVAALNRFRQAAGLPTSKQIDDATRAKLVDWHDQMKASDAEEADDDVAGVDTDFAPPEEMEADLSEEDIESFDDAISRKK